MSNQIPLPPNSILQIHLENGCSLDYSITKVIGYGGSCIVYQGKSLSDNILRTQIIKEFYPADFSSIMRSGTKLEVSDQDFEAFAQRKQEFYNTISKYSRYFESNSNYTNARPFLSGEANGTVYAVSDPSQGMVLSSIDRNTLDLHSISRIMYSICSAIQNFHDHGLLYLDCKPDNIFVYNIDNQYHIRLFDFDTVAKIDDIRSGTYKYSHFSPGWAPAEQKSWRTNEISQKTDIFSVGAVFFYLLTGSKPNSNDIRKVTHNCYPWRSIPSFLTRASDKSLQISQQILAKALQPNHSSRYESINKLKKDFQTLSSVTKGTYTEDFSIYDVLSIIEQKLESLTEKLTKSLHTLQIVLVVALLTLSFTVYIRISQNTARSDNQNMPSEEASPVEQIHIFNQDFLLLPGTSEKLKIGIYPNDADINTLQYSSQDFSVASLEEYAGEWFVVAPKVWQEDANHNTVISVKSQLAIDTKKVSIQKPIVTSENNTQNAFGGGKIPEDTETIWGN